MIRLPAHLGQKISKVRRLTVEMAHDLGHEPSDEELADEIGISAERLAELKSGSTEAVLRDELAVLPIGVYNARYGVTLSLPSVIGREGVNRILVPAMSDEEQRALRQSAEVLR
jgi:DNA-binding Xre family transcriptional regulator